MDKETQKSFEESFRRCIESSSKMAGRLSSVSALLEDVTNLLEIQSAAMQEMIALANTKQREQIYSEAYEEMRISEGVNDGN